MSFSVIFIAKYWSKLSISDIVSLVILYSGATAGLLKYRHFIYDWPKELSIKTLKREKEIENLKK